VADREDRRSWGGVPVNAKLEGITGNSVGEKKPKILIRLRKPVPQDIRDCETAAIAASDLHLRQRSRRIAERARAQMKVSEMRAGRQRGKVWTVLHPAGRHSGIASPGQRASRIAHRMIERRAAGAFRKGKRGSCGLSHYRDRHKRRALPGGIER